MLYEIEFQKYYEDEDKRSAVRTHQIPALGQWDACAKLGQIFSSEDYELKILSVKKVR